MSIASSALAPLGDQWEESHGWAWAGARRHLSVVTPEPHPCERAGIWADPAFAEEAAALTAALRGLALLEAEVLSI